MMIFILQLAIGIWLGLVMAGGTYKLIDHVDKGKRG